MKFPTQGGVRKGRRLLVSLLLSLFVAAPTAALAQEAGDEDRESAALSEYQAAQSKERLAPDVHIVRVLRSSRLRGAPSAEALAEQLVAPGAAALAPLFSILEERRVPLSGLPDEKAQILSRPQREIVLAGLGLLGRQPVLAALGRRLAEGPAAGRPMAAIDVLGAVGDAREIARVLELVPPGEEDALEDAVTDAWSRLLKRDAGGQATIASLYPRIGKALRPAALDAIGAARDPRALPLLTRVMQQEPELVAHAIAKVRLVGRSARPELNEAAAYLLRGWIASREDRHARAAVIALGELGDVEALPGMVAMLDEDVDAGLRENALWALRRASGITETAGEPDFWSRWVERESAWHAEERPAALEALRSPRGDVVVAAIRALGSHPLYRDELAPEIAALAEHDDPALRAYACKVLGELGSTSTIETLLAAREDSDAKVRAAAIDALAAMRKRELPRDTPAWADGPEE